MKLLADDDTWRKIRDTVHTLLKEKPTRLTKDQREFHEELLRDLDDEGVRVNFKLACRLSRVLAALIASTETDIGATAVTKDIQAWWDAVRVSYEERDTLVRGVVAECGYEWDDEDVLVSVKRVARGIEDLHYAFVKHFTVAGGDTINMPVLTPPAHASSAAPSACSTAARRSATLSSSPPSVSPQWSLPTSQR